MRVGGRAGSEAARSRERGTYELKSEHTCVVGNVDSTVTGKKEKKRREERERRVDVDWDGETRDREELNRGRGTNLISEAEGVKGGQRDAESEWADTGQASPPGPLQCSVCARASGCPGLAGNSATTAVVPR
jgi:hypothetical protein